MKRSIPPINIPAVGNPGGNLSKRMCLEHGTTNDHSTSATVNGPTSCSASTLCFPREPLKIKDYILESFTDGQFDQQTQTISDRDVGSSICIHQGNLRTEQTDVIVVCRSSRTLRKSILKAGGDSVKNLFDAELTKDSTSPVISLAARGHITAKKIYFLAWKPPDDVNTFRQSISTFIFNAMSTADSENYRSIAFPAIGCGGYECSISLIAQTMVEEVHRQLVTYPVSVSFVIQSHRMDVYDEFQKQISSIQLIPKTEAISVRIGKGIVEVQTGDITVQKVDVIIGSSSSKVLERTIMNAAGRYVEAAYTEQCEKDSNSLIVSLPSGQLPCKQIFFVKWQPDPNDDLRQSLVDFIWTVIQNIISYKFTSVAFPAIGCGEHACPADLVAKTMVKEIKNQLKMRNIPLTVRFVIQPERQNLYEEFSKQVLSLQEGPEPLINYQLPSTWEQSTENKLRFLVPDYTHEYDSIVNNFDQTMKGKYTSIIQIERIQNERWFIQYLAHSQEFHKRLNTNTERRLYHGCLQSATNLIIKDNFNRSFAGANGTSYGIGVYFSSDANYSNHYAEANSNGERCMFVARVLIGKTTRGDPSVKSPPVGFDSTTDEDHIFVTYHDAQAYAEYLITYE